MTITYDKEANAAYIYFNKPSKGYVLRTVPVSNDIIVDFGLKGRLLGIEILNASKHISAIELGSAEMRMLPNNI